MMKVMIADDEIKVCQLINYLVDWDNLGMEVVATAHNGFEALKGIDHYKPDIVITDIKMPGMSGLEMIEQAKSVKEEIEFIVISGYKQFDYAQKAIQYGVSNYLLKPINQQELIRTLTVIRDKHLERSEQLSRGERLEVFEQEQAAHKRKQFISRVKRRSIDNWSPEEINREYNYHFKPGIFLAFAIKIDGLHNQSEEKQAYIDKKISSELQESLQSSYDAEFIREEGVYLFVCNLPDHGVDVDEILTRLLKNLLQQQDVLKDFQVTIGRGPDGCEPQILKNGFKMAMKALDDRLIRGTNQVLTAGGESDNDFVEGELFHTFNRNFYQAIELQSIDEMKEAIDNLAAELLASHETTGYLIYQMCKEAVNAYLFALKKLEYPDAEAIAGFRNFHREIHNCGRAKDTFAYLKESIVSSFRAVLAKKMTYETRPIRLAKQYINEHLSEPITLEAVSDIAGFNTAYFSTMFKKETGETFSEYLLLRRMEKAKELLRETGDSVATICEQVGYSDVKHFTKNFAKYTRLKPKEYRKLYS